ncbi:GEVED domain-containing protein [Hymenobacter siberiensis]|uniref:GEVED domain-containing protein n=1 Tax=Hymenobacter siberiensis TaxID=2848396 RepID=UPI001C1E43C1|nr:GEVED domain-containing protein [Hymenobacter siberiensis]
MGIYRVRLANLDTITNGSADGYRDYSCQRRANLLQGSTYTLRVQTGTSAAENAVAWLDYNNDGMFAAGERILYSLNARTHTVNFTVPATAILNQALRLRIAADYANSPIPTACSTPQYSQTEDYQVRIMAGNAAPVAHFAAVDSITCSGVVALRDNSFNTPVAWRWRFGDGTTSTQQHPTHTYAAAGTYAVSLRVCNPSGCDSLTRPAYVRVRTDGPRTSSCQPATLAYCCQFGLIRVRLAGLNNASVDGQAGYEDFSCAQRATLTADRPDTLRLTTGPSAHDVRVYLDLNDDGQFSGAAELLYQGLSVRSPVVPLTISSAWALVYNKALRLRIVADIAGSTATSACGPVQAGQAEDYSLVVVPNAAPPASAFTAHYERLCDSVRVAFANTSVGGATSYHWNFGDGTTSTAAAPPAHLYLTAGVYEVQLVAQNAFGRDTARQRVAVATACPSYCTAGGGSSSSAPAYFTRFQFANLDNTDFRGPGVGYRDFTARYAMVQAGQSYTVRAESLPWIFSGPGPWVAVEAWIDYNQDGEFGPSEQVSSQPQFSPQSVSITIPAAAKAGATRLRAIMHSVTSFVPTSTCTPGFINAAVEDYTVVIVPPPVAPTAAFAADQPASCNPLVQFRDQSVAAPNRWQWSFGDGGTSTLQHPLHTYAAPGTYTVTLQAGNQYGTNTATRSGYVSVSASTSGPRPASCLPSPTTGTTGAGHGMGTLEIGPVFTYHQPANAPGYRDETCTQVAIALTAGASASFYFADSNYSGTACFVWLDANDNGLFEAPQELLFNSLATGFIGGTFRGIITVPATTLLNQPLRLRVACWGMPFNTRLTTVPDPCRRQEELGQVRDFTVRVSSTLSTVPAGAAPTSWSLAPNPSTGLVRVQGSFTGLTTVEIHDVVGRCVYKAPARPSVDGTLNLNLTALPNGVYLVQLNHSGQVSRLLLE